MGAATDVFHAIADPTRRTVLDLLLTGERTATELSQPFSVTKAAVSQHLRVLREAGLVTERRVGRQRIYRLRPAPLSDVAAWLAHYEQFWAQRLKDLGRYLDEDATRPRRQKSSD